MPSDAKENSDGHAGFKKLFATMIGAFPDLTFATQFMMGEGDMVGACNTVSGAHRGEFMGIPATWKSFTVNNADHCRFTEDNLICEHWA